MGESTGQAALKQNAWAASNPGWDDNYVPGVFGKKSKDYFNVLRDRQVYDYNTDKVVNDVSAVTGYQSSRNSLKQQPFESAYQHTPSEFAAGGGPVTNPSPFASVMEGNKPWQDSYEESKPWAGSKNYGGNNLFDVYKQPFEYNQEDGSMNATPIAIPTGLDEYSAPTPWSNEFFK